MSERQSGTVKFFNTQKGYGFIIGPAQEGDKPPEYFVHYSAISGDGFKSLDSGETVEYDLELNAGTNKLCAVNVSGPGGGPVKGAPQNNNTKGAGKGGKGMPMEGGKGGKKGGKGKGKGKGKSYDPLAGQMNYYGGMGGVDPYSAMMYGGAAAGGGCGFPGFFGYPSPFPTAGGYPGAESYLQSAS